MEEDGERTNKQQEEGARRVREVKEKEEKGNIWKSMTLVHKGSFTAKKWL
jgi:hypothetical protein